MVAFAPQVAMVPKPELFTLIPLGQLATPGALACPGKPVPVV